MKKFTVILMAMVMALSCAACSNTNKNTSNNNSGNTSSSTDTKKDDNKNNSKNNNDNNKSDNKTEVKATTVEIEKKIADAVGKDNYLCDLEIDKDTMTNYYGFDMAKVESYTAKQNKIASVNPDTVIILKVKDGYAGKAVEALNTSYSQMVDYIRQYPFGTQKVMNARIYQSGNYVMYILAGASYDGEDSDAEAKLAKSEYEKIDNAVKSIFGEVPANSAIVPEQTDSNSDSDDNNGGNADDNGGILIGG